MKAKSQFTLILLLLMTKVTLGQLNISFTNDSIVGEKWRDVELIIPVEIKLKNVGNNSINGTVEFSIDNSKTIGLDATQISSSEFANIEIRNYQQQFTVDKKKTSIATFYMVVKKDLVIIGEKDIYINATTNGNTAAAKVTLKRANDITYTLNDYINNDNLKLNYVTKVESNNNTLTVYGYKDNNHSKINLMLESHKAFAVNEWSFVWNSKHWKPFPISLTTIPFKIRPGLSFVNRDSINNPIDTTNFKSQATMGLTNIGFNIDLVKFQMDRYFSTGRKSSHKFSVGFWAAPSVEEMDSVTTRGFLEKNEKTRQLYISTGLTISYSYNDISFVVVPIGIDIGTSTVGKNWIYNGQLWWGFGIAISPKIFSTIVNK